MASITNQGGEMEGPLAGFLVARHGGFAGGGQHNNTLWSAVAALKVGDGQCWPRPLGPKGCCEMGAGLYWEDWWASAKKTKGK
jgi:hypothetical protein